jgi:HD-GYP domain-containing protein (c-di-GMP phosphodiesterase class II)
MAAILISNLKIGTITETELLGKNGDVLVNKGVILTHAVVGALSRRGIQEVFIRDADDEIKKILSTKITSMEELQFDDEVDSLRYQENVEEIVREEPQAAALKEFTELNKIKRGEDGFKEILQTTKVKDFERKLDNQFEELSDKPAGKPLSATAKQLEVKERTAEYKTSVSLNYNDALFMTKNILEGLRDGQIVDGKKIQNLVEKFIETYVTDKNILLNISNTKSKTDDYIHHHSLNVCLLSINIAAAAGYGKIQICQIGMGALLHDIGMMLIPQGIRSKTTPLSKDEFYEIKKHPVLGLHLLEKVGYLPDTVSYIAYQTHEREDGNGYPKGRTGRFLHTFARIVMIADVFEALSSPRPYRPAFIPYKAMELLLSFVRKNRFRPELVRSFIDYSSLFPVGSLVKLNTEEIAKVIHANAEKHTKPVVSVIAGKNSVLYPENKITQIDLAKEKDMKIIQALPSDAIDVEIMKGF